MVYEVFRFVEDRSLAAQFVLTSDGRLEVLGADLSLKAKPKGYLTRDSEEFIYRSDISVVPSSGRQAGLMDVKAVAGADGVLRFSVEGSPAIVKDCGGGAGYLYYLEKAGECTEFSVALEAV